LISGGEEGN